MFRGPDPDSPAYRFIRFDQLPSVKPQILEQLVQQIQNNEGFTLTATLRQDRASRGTLLSIEGPGERRQFEVLSDGKANTLELVYWWADGSRNVIAFEDVELVDSQWKNVTLHVHGETATLYVGCSLIDSFILDEPFYEHLGVSGGRMYVGKGSSRDTHFRVRAQDIILVHGLQLKLLFTTPQIISNLQLLHEPGLEKKISGSWEHL